MDHRINKLAYSLNWRDFEYKVIKHVKLDWDTQIAEAFIRYVCTSKDVPYCALLVVTNTRWKNRVGQYTLKEIRIHDSVNSEEKWRTLLHELAHALSPRQHDREFVLALAEVYKMWKQFRKKLRVSSRSNKL